VAPPTQAGAGGSPVPCSLLIWGQLLVEIGLLAHVAVPDPDHASGVSFAPPVFLSERVAGPCGPVAGAPVLGGGIPRARGVLCSGSGRTHQSGVVLGACFERHPPASGERHAVFALESVQGPVAAVPHPHTTRAVLAALECHG